MAFGFLERKHCPACASDRVEEIFNTSFSAPGMKAFLKNYYKVDVNLSGNYAIDACAVCDTLYQREVGNEELLTELYDRWIFPRDPESDPGYRYDVTNPLKSRDGHELMAASAFLGLPLAAMTTLDFGMGYAGWARVSAAIGCRSHGSDLAANRVEYALRHGVLPDLGERYHFINCEQVFEHLTDPREVVSQLAEKLQTNGILKISVPAQHRIRDTLAEVAAGKADIATPAIVPLHPLEHINAFSRKGIEAIGKSFGLRLVRPSIMHDFAFLSHRGAVPINSFRRFSKEIVRPLFHWSNPTNTYVWLQAS